MKNKFIYFDVGGVVINDFSGNDGWDRLINSLNIDNKLEFIKWWKENSKNIDTGMDLEDKVDNLKDTFNIELPEKFSFIKAFVDMFSQNKNIWPVIEYAKSKANIGLLTNMYKGMLSQIFEANLIPNTELNVIVDSSVEECKKPNSEIYKIAQLRANIDARNIMFIDNKKANVNTAKELGWEVFLYDPTNHEKSCKDLLKSIDEFLKK